MHNPFCDGNHPGKEAARGVPYHEGMCWLCWLALNEPHWLGLSPHAAPPPATASRPRFNRLTTPCIHLGADTGQRKDCGTCGGGKQIPLVACAKHGVCTTQRQLVYKENDRIVQVAWCRTCPDYEARRDVRKLTLVNHLSPGDVLCMSGAIECLHQQFPGQFATAVDTTCNAIFENNPHVVAADESFERIPMEYPLIHQCGQRAVHFLQGYVDFLKAKLGVPLELTVNRPYVYLSEEEKSWMGRIQEILGRPQRYWLVCAGTKSDYVAKGWGHANYQEVVERLRGKVLFVQIGEKDHLHRPLRNVVDQIGRTNHRELVRLVFHADGVLCGTTFLMHLAAALEKPAVIVAGGREPRSWNTFPKQTLFSTVGMLPCCQTPCWKSRVVPLNDGDEKDKSLCEYPVYGEEPIPKCMTMIRPAEVAQAILNYYEGGALTR